MGGRIREKNTRREDVQCMGKDGSRAGRRSRGGERGEGRKVQEGKIRGGRSRIGCGKEDKEKSKRKGEGRESRRGEGELRGGKG